MSRLDSVIRRLTAQREILNHVAELIAAVPGPVLELGLGNGRSYDHLCARLPEREVFAFDRAINAHPSCLPDGAHMVLGEIRDTLQFCGPRVKARAALILCDLGSGDPTTDLATCHWLSPLIHEHCAPGGVVASGLELDLPDFLAMPLPEGIEPGRYFLYRRPLD